MKPDGAVRLSNDAHKHASVQSCSLFRVQPYGIFVEVIKLRVQVSRDVSDQDVSVPVESLSLTRERRRAESLSRAHSPSSDARRMSDSAGGGSDEPASTLIGSLVAAFKERLAGGSKR